MTRPASVPPSRSAVELTADPRMHRRVRRLVPISALALGAIWALWVGTPGAQPAIGAGLLAGALLMPSLLWLSLRWPRVRYALLLPASLVGGSLLAIAVTARADEPVARLGWLLMLGGVLFGGVLGAWFWYRWLPVPHALDDPYSVGRWLLVGVHALLVLAGLGLLLVGSVWPAANGIGR